MVSSIFLGFIHNSLIYTAFVLLSVLLSFFLTPSSSFQPVTHYCREQGNQSINQGQDDNALPFHSAQQQDSFVTAQYAAWFVVYADKDRVAAAHPSELMH